MSDSGLFSKLADLIDDHLSKIPVNTSTMGTDIAKQPSGKELQNFEQFQNIIPGLNINKIKTNNVINDVSNLKPKEETKLHIPLTKLISEEDDKEEDLIDLVSCLTLLDVPRKQNSISYVSENVNYEIIEKLEENNKIKVTIPKLRCVLGLADCNKNSTTEKFKINKKCSGVGKAICTRFIEYSEPYWTDYIQTDLVRFEFSVLSPDDIVKERLKPKYYPNIV